MNIFVLDINPINAARFHLDKHIVKMPLETAQILSTINGGPYKPTHKNHPCTKWAMESRANYSWLVKFGFALCDEYTFRYGKTHACEFVIWQCRFAPDSLPDIEMTPFALAMPDDCKQHDAVTSYRSYYKNHKSSIAKWTNRPIPEFMQ